MDHPKLFNSTLNPTASWWFPTWNHNANETPGCVVIPEGSIIVNAEAFRYSNAVCQPECQEDIIRCVGMLGSGKMATTDLTMRELLGVYFKCVKNPNRPYDLSSSVVAALNLRMLAYNVSQTLPAAQGDSRKHDDIVQLQTTLSRLNNLIRRVLFAEQFGTFPYHATPTLFPMQDQHTADNSQDITPLQAYIMPYLASYQSLRYYGEYTNGLVQEHAFSALQDEVIKALEEQLSGKRRGNRLPQDFVP
ncbi:hypothetical protein F5Y04DRAFT_283757 [Hypomontagnella monticulosa]|nr:hypothetical protein F5Y04DRAFT_283757 [Hypomontagnella monticulosa]